VVADHFAPPLTILLVVFVGFDALNLAFIIVVLPLTFFLTIFIKSFVVGQAFIGIAGAFAV
jgi:hypothetical protein